MTCFAKSLTAIFAVSLLTAKPILSDDRFIDGFPDVPYLDIISTMVGQPVVFDTAGGTVAEVGILFSVSPEQVIADYDSALAGLGWACSKTPTALSCVRDDSIMQLSPSQDAGSDTTFILRLEPRQ